MFLSKFAVSLVVVLAATSACSPSPQQVVDDACPIVTRSSPTDEVSINKAFEDAGLSRKEAVDATVRYSGIVSLAPSLDSTSAICDAAVTNNQDALARYLNIATQKAALESRTRAFREKLKTYGDEAKADLERTQELCASRGWTC